MPKDYVKPNEVNVEVETTVREPVTVELTEWQGSDYLSVRHWYQTEEGTYARTKKGIMIPLADADKLMVAIQEAVSQAGNRVRQQPLL